MKDDRRAFAEAHLAYRRQSRPCVPSVLRSRIGGLRRDEVRMCAERRYGGSVPDRADSMSNDYILRVITATLREVTRLKDILVRPSDSFAEDLRRDGDDMSFLVTPELEMAFGIRVRVDDWSSVHRTRSGSACSCL